MKIKKSLMELMWRMQQSQAIIGVLMWSLTLTGIFYPYMRDKFNLDPSKKLLPMLALFVLIFLGVITIGLVFDKLRFWKEQNIVMAERNPYANYKLYPKEVYWARLWLAVARQQPDPPPEVRREIEFFETWIRKLMAEDPCYRQEVLDVEGYVSGRGPAPAPGNASK